jgi:hypothetical protein
VIAPEAVSPAPGIAAVLITSVAFAGRPNCSVARSDPEPDRKYAYRR